MELAAEGDVGRKKKKKARESTTFQPQSESPEAA